MRVGQESAYRVLWRGHAEEGKAALGTFASWRRGVYAERNERRREAYKRRVEKRERERVLSACPPGLPIMASMATQHVNVTVR